MLWFGISENTCFAYEKMDKMLNVNASFCKKKIRNNSVGNVTKRERFAVVEWSGMFLLKRWGNFFVFG